MQALLPAASHTRPHFFQLTCACALSLAYMFTLIQQRGTFWKNNPMSTNLQSYGDEPSSGHTLPLLYNVVYCSRAAPGVDGAAVDRIIESSRRWNPARGITGLLVFGSGIFFQWLEGPRHSVMELMALLQTDTRHAAIVPLSTMEEMRERLFPDWDMELVTATDIRDVLVDALEHAKDEQNAAALRLLLEELDSGQLGGLGKT